MGQKTNILIVNGNTGVSDNVSTILESNGYAVTLAKDGDEALERVREKDFDMTFMEIGLFLENGGETYRELKKMRPSSEIVVTMTSHGGGNGEEAMAPLAEVVWGPLFRPFGAERIFALIDEARLVKEGAMIRRPRERMRPPLQKAVA